MILATLSEFSTPVEILQEMEQQYWAAEGIGIEAAISQQKVPCALKEIAPRSVKQRQICAVRMFIAYHLGQEMISRHIGDEELARELSRNLQWSRLCRIVRPTISSHWIGTQAPLYGEGRDIKLSWKDLEDTYLARHALAPIIAQAVALGVVNNQIATDHFTYVQSADQIKVFVEYCRRSIQLGDRDDHFLEQELSPYKKRELARVGVSYNCSRFT